jgi:hypothetical protein
MESIFFYLSFLTFTTGLGIFRSEMTLKKYTGGRHRATWRLVFWVAMLCTMVNSTKNLEKLFASIYRAEAGSYEMLVPIYKNTWCHSPEGHNLHIHCHKNLKPLTAVCS